MKVIVEQQREAPTWLAYYVAAGDQCPFGLLTGISYCNFDFVLTRLNSQLDRTDARAVAAHAARGI